MTTSHWACSAAFRVAGATTALVLSLCIHVPCLAQGRSLFIEWVGVVDNGEGDGEHGPLGSLHIDLYNSAGQKFESFILQGPSRGEWLDGDQESYWVYIGNVWPQNPAIRIRISESDPGPLRDDDVVFDGWATHAGVMYSAYAAHGDARLNALRRGANSWAANVWQGGIQGGIPMAFVGIAER